MSGGEAIDLGTEWVVEATGCEAARLRDRPAVEGFLTRLMESMRLHAATPRVVHVFPGPGGITALELLTESHLAIHTFPEHGALTLNLYCCKPRGPFAWETALREAFGASHVTVRELARHVRREGAAP